MCSASAPVRGTDGAAAMRHGVVTRGVLYDIPRLRGVRHLDPGGQGRRHRMTTRNARMVGSAVVALLPI